MKPIYVTRPSMPELDEFVEEIRPIFEEKILTNMGPMYKKFQKLLMEYLEVPELSLFTNGHLALELGIQALGLKKQGVDKERILTEKSSRTTAQNARLSLELLQRDHPEIKYIAIVSGDYHVKVGVLFFEAAAILQTEPGEEPPVQVIAWAGCKTSNDELSSQFRAGGLMEMAGNQDAASRFYYDRYDLKKYPPLS